MNEPEKVQIVNIELLIPNEKQPRKIFNDESLKELALSIKEYGIINPIIVRPLGEKYEIIAGERRYRAAKQAGLKEVPVIIKKLDDAASAAIALIENLHRENITPIEEAKAYDEILKTASLTESKLSEMVGKSQSSIANKLRLLKLPEYVQQALLERKISERHARSLLNVDSQEKQKELLEKIISEKLTVKELDQIINEKEITEEEIQTAINDIIDTLKINDIEEKEEKESDNMNDGNFFPNINSNVGAPSPAPVNAGVMSPMGGIPIEMPQPQPMPMPNQNPAVAPVTPGPLPTLPQENLPTSPVPTTEQLNQSPLPTLSPVEINPIPDFGQSMVNNVEPTPQMVDAPLFSNEPQIQPAVTPEINNPAPAPTEVSAAIDAPLFNDNPVPAPAQVPETVAEVAPVAPQENLPVDKLSQVQEFLNSNGVTYKTYSNENNHCIIIEL